MAAWVADWHVSSCLYTHHDAMTVVITGGDTLAQTTYKTTPTSHNRPDVPTGYTARTHR